MLGAHKPLARETAKRVLNMEEVLGTDWLNKLGMSILVIGVALFLAYEMRELGPAGKVLVGFVVSGALLGAGIFFERRERYRLLARVAIGGGWALTFFTTYAMYHVAPARVLNSQVLDLVLLLAVAAAMVVHTLRYNSQVVTGMALLLGFTTVTISKDNVYSLSAGAILAVALVIIVLAAQMVRTGNLRHSRQLLQSLLLAAAHHRTHGRASSSFPGVHAERRAADLLLAGVSRFLFAAPRGERGGGKGFHRCRAAQHLPASWHDEVPIRASGVGFPIPFGAGRGGIHARAVAHRPAPARGICGFSASSAPPSWWRRFRSNIRARRCPSSGWRKQKALFLAGVFLNEILFSRLGLLASILVAFQLDRFALLQIFDSQWKGFHGGELLRGIMEFAATTLIFYGDAHWLARRSSRLAESRFETGFLRVLSYVAGVTAVIGVWWLAPEAWVAVGFAALGLILMVLASRTDIREFVWQAHAAAVLAFLRALVVTLGDESLHHHLMLRLVTVGLTAALLYACAYWAGRVRTVTARYLSSAHTWTASLLLGLLAWYELDAMKAAQAWLLLGLALLVIGRARSLPYLRWQAYVAFAFSFQQSNLFALEQIFDPQWKGFYGTELLRGIMEFSATVLILYCAAHSLERRPPASAESPLEAEVRRGLSYAAGVTAMVGIWWLTPEAWVAVGFAAFGLTLLVLGSRTNIRDFVYQAHAAAVLAFLRVLVVNLGEPEHSPPCPGPARDGGAHGRYALRQCTLVESAANAFYEIRSLRAYLDRIAAGRAARLVRTDSR